MVTSAKTIHCLVWCTNYSTCVARSTKGTRVCLTSRFRISSTPLCASLCPPRSGPRLLQPTLGPTRAPPLSPHPSSLDLPHSTRGVLSALALEPPPVPRPRSHCYYYRQACHPAVQTGVERRGFGAERGSFALCRFRRTYKAGNKERRAPRVSSGGGGGA